jgi:hypothetical protein
LPEISLSIYELQQILMDERISLTEPNVAFDNLEDELLVGAWLGRPWALPAFLVRPLGETLSASIRETERSWPMPTRGGPAPARWLFGIEEYFCNHDALLAAVETSQRRGDGPSLRALAALIRSDREPLNASLHDEARRLSCHASIAKDVLGISTEAFSDVAQWYAFREHMVRVRGDEMWRQDVASVFGLGGAPNDNWVRGLFHARVWPEVDRVFSLESARGSAVEHLMSTSSGAIACLDRLFFDRHPRKPGPVPLLQIVKLATEILGSGGASMLVPTDMGRGLGQLEIAPLSWTEARDVVRAAMAHDSWPSGWDRLWWAVALRANGLVVDELSEIWLASKIRPVLQSTSPRVNRPEGVDMIVAKAIDDARLAPMAMALVRCWGVHDFAVGRRFAEQLCAFAIEGGEEDWARSAALLQLPFCQGEERFWLDAARVSRLADHVPKNYIARKILGVPRDASVPSDDGGAPWSVVCAILERHSDYPDAVTEVCLRRMVSLRTRETSPLVDEEWMLAEA